MIVCIFPSYLSAPSPIFLKLHRADADLSGRLLAPPLPDLLVDALIKFDVLTLHVPRQERPDILHSDFTSLPPRCTLHVAEGDDIYMLLQWFYHSSYTFRLLRLQFRRFGCDVTLRLVLIITHAGTRRFCSHAFASRIFRPFVNLLMILTLDN